MAGLFLSSLIFKQMLLNDLDISSLHLDRLVKDVLTSPAIEQNFLETEVASAKTGISSLLPLSAKFKSTLRVRNSLQMPLVHVSLLVAGWRGAIVQPAHPTQAAELHS